MASDPLDRPGCAGTPTTTTNVGPIRWMSPECSWEPETGHFHGNGGLHSPDLGMQVARDKDKPSLMNPQL